jgi:hypothetical protein
MMMILAKMRANIRCAGKHSEHTRIDDRWICLTWGKNIIISCGQIGYPQNSVKHLNITQQI